MILCAGEALIDMLPRRTEAGEDAFAPHTGGSVFNTAIALGRLEVETGFFGGVSNDLFGKMLAADLTRSGVDLSYTLRSDRPTTLAFVHLAEGHASYTFYDENSAMRSLAQSDIPALGTDIEALFFGCISLISEPAGTTYEALLSDHGAGRVTMIDPNIRTSFIRDEAAYRARLDRMIALCDVVKISDEDLAWLSEGADPADAARAILGSGPALVCVTAGAKGATVYGAMGAFQVAAAPAKVVDTVGAGDTFNAGLLAGLRGAGLLSKPALRGDLSEVALRPAVELAARAAAVTVSRAGANPPTREELA